MDMLHREIQILMRLFHDYFNSRSHSNILRCSVNLLLIKKKKELQSTVGKHQSQYSEKREREDI
jgi:hypothetical protein